MSRKPWACRSFLSVVDIYCIVIYIFSLQCCPCTYYSAYRNKHEKIEFLPVGRRLGPGVGANIAMDLNRKDLWTQLWN